MFLSDKVGLPLIPSSSLFSLFFFKGWPFVAGSAQFGKLGLFGDDGECGTFVSDCPIRLNVLAPRSWARADKVSRTEEPKLPIRKICAASGHSLMCVVAF